MVAEAVDDDPRYASSASASADISVAGGNGMEQRGSQHMMRPARANQQQLTGVAFKGGSLGQGALVMVVAFPVLVCAAAFWVWKQSKKDQQRTL